MFWVIEQYQGGEPRYWEGHKFPSATIVDKSLNMWSEDHAGAVKFYDRESAAKVLLSLCDNIGRVVRVAELSSVD